ncbi:right-handed parallel beta-helix repeat-containing protein [Prevotella sp. PINT]|uniref:right-handed parallel beta-helix repeat-containing protein n=1 Tax=Palleniella intestinalis TaxID=2736291 RepID=UPI0015574051|nr:right-handed parallel beta-helix repeat-containing protein [Palleniella intestinalis]NPD81448.1 right-handed parallel beta-helix repeat-containing protein [Palleniella intestinalis]
MKRQILLLFLVAVNLHCFAGDIYVSVSGSDKAIGDKNAPVQTLQKALRIAREWRRTNNPNMKGGITINLAKGETFVLDEPLYIRPEDSGTTDSPTVIMGGTISGGQADNSCSMDEYPKMERMLAFDKDKEQIIIPAKSLQTYGITNVADAAKYEMVVHQRWAIAILRIKAIRISGNKAIVTFRNPESRWEFSHPWPQPVIGEERGSSSFLMRPIAYPSASLSRLVTIEGSEYASVHDISFKNVSFENASWERPLKYGHVTLQGGFPIIDAYKLTENEGTPWAPTLENQAWVIRPEAAVSVTYAERVNFKDCTFTNLSSTALDYAHHCADAMIVGNKFENIGGTAIMAGSFGEGPCEAHHPRNYTNTTGFVIDSNIIHNATTCDWGAVAVGCGYVRDFVIRKNKVSKVNYSGICVGWGWTPEDTGMRNNRITENTVTDYARILYDAGGIYTMSNQPGSLIEHNTVSSPYPSPYATNFRAFPIYFDACTDGYTVRNNSLSVNSSVQKEKYGWNNPGPKMDVEK